MVSIIKSRNYLVQTSVSILDTANKYITIYSALVVDAGGGEESILGFHDGRVMAGFALVVAFFLYFISYHRYHNSLLKIKPAL